MKYLKTLIIPVALDLMVTYYKIKSGVYIHMQKELCHINHLS